MPSLLLDNVPNDLYRQLQELAEARQVPLAEETLHLLRLAVAQQQLNGGTAPRSQREILEDIVRNQFPPWPGGPSVVEMLREDRER